ncbi:MAG: RimK family protein [Polyangiaceae bacterium]
MRALIIVGNPKEWRFHIPGVEVVAARSYLTDARYSELRNVAVFNLSRSYRYQATGYYVSLLAAARGHKPIPSVSTIQELKANEIVRIRSDDLDELIQRSLAPIQSSSFSLSVYFGRNLAKRYDRLSAHLFKLFFAPLLRVSFNRSRGGRWYLSSVNAIGAGEIPASHLGFVRKQATQYFKQGRFSAPRRKSNRYNLALLYDASDSDPPSDDKAVTRLIRAAARRDMSVTVIGKDDYTRLSSFDALFIRETTHVNHHTYRFARRARAEGLVVIDDPDSILRCTNKVYLYELLTRHEIPSPRTLVVHKDNIDTVEAELGLPCILKKPDSAFSQGVHKVGTKEELFAQAEALLAKSDLIVAQEWFPTEFDWRVGVLDGQPIWAAKYFMAPRHWQIQKGTGTARRYGRVEAIPLADAPKAVVRLGVRAANLIGHGLYGVDLKQRGRRITVIEINDNPSLEAGYEDAAEGDVIYDAIVDYFVRGIEARRTGNIDDH